MRKYFSTVYIVILVSICGLFVLNNIDSLWSSSGDLAQHYALAFRISEQFDLINANDPSLGPMNSYPRVSHTIAAIVGVLVNSTFLGLQVTTLLSLALLWLGVLLILNSLRNDLAVASIVCSVALVALNAVTMRFDIHGSEIIGNFYFAQFVGQALVFLSFCIAIYIEGNRGWFWATAFLIAIMIINASIHLLPAIELLGVICGLILVYVFINEESEKVLSYRILLGSCIAFITIFSLVIHPSFREMMSISKHNGSLNLNSISYPLGLISLCFLTLFMSFGLIFIWMRNPDRNENIAIKYFSIYGSVTSALCLLQLFLIRYGFGSEYAVKKYGFSIVTIFLIELSIIFGGIICFFFKGMKIRLTEKIGQFHCSILAVALCVILTLITPNSKVIDVSDVVSLERNIISLNDTVIKPPPHGKNNVVFGLDGVSNIIEFMFSIGILKTTMNPAIQDFLINHYLSDLDKYYYVISSYDNSLYGAGDCPSLSHSDLSVVSSACLKERLSKPCNCRPSIDFSKSKFIPYNALEGFSIQEEAGRWTEGKMAKIHCINSGAPLRTLHLVFGPFIGGSLKSQRISISINGTSLGTFNIAAGRGPNDPLTLVIPEDVDTQKISLEFLMPDATSPSQLGLSTDARILGFFFQSISFN